jgi:hypothetical protein
LAEAQLQKQLEAQALDVTLPGRVRGQGSLHPVSLAQERIEHIQTEQIQINAEVTNNQTAMQERQALYAHDIALGQGAAQWVTNRRAATRSVITYGMFAMFMFVEIFGFYYAWHTNVEFTVALDNLWDDETQIIWACIVSFWFGGQAFKSK